ncbi:uncharacterized protein [Fopius arisanus]|uniref:CI16A protein n=1 Tax=Fopius arisanus TaxID=64838 RepID=A0A0C9R7Z2_9HYME|nr:PREDICTED: uncharacterized protein LOC105273293 [Fopius arisanus]XP_011313944.1 PREDICTED: uncharacterized protein LOC105273293 [Fopius arisanus]
MESHFAALRIPEAPEKSLTRAMSFSELPTRRRIIIQQTEASGELVRQYSCEQIYDKASNTRRINFLTSVTSKLGPATSHWKPMPLSSLEKKSSWHQRIPSISVKPEASRNLFTSGFKAPKILTSASTFLKPPEKSTTAAHITSNSPHSDLLPIIPPEAPTPIPKFTQPSSTTSEENSNENNQSKKKLRPLIPAEHFKPPERRITSYKIVFFGLLSVAVLIISTLISDFDQKPLDFANTSMALRKNVLGQSEAIETLIDHFQSNFNNFTAVILVGGIGVGKTYTTNIIKEHFPHKHNIFEFFPPIMKQIPSAYEMLSHHYCNLLIVENLKTEDEKDFVALTKFFQKQAIRPCLIILGVLNPQVTDDHLVRTMNLKETVKELQNLFRQEGINSKVIPFSPLGAEVISECIMREIKNNGIVLTDENYQKIETQLLMTNNGCKGVNGKVNLLRTKKIL